MTEQKEALLPCPNPWCGSHMRDDDRPYVYAYRDGYTRVRCPVCPQIGPGGDTEAEAITAWNTRSQPPVAVPVELVEMREALTEYHSAVEELVATDFFTGRATGFYPSNVRDIDDDEDADRWDRFIAARNKIATLTSTPSPVEERRQVQGDSADADRRQS